MVTIPEEYPEMGYPKDPGPKEGHKEEWMPVQSLS